jgi:WD40 repeat protein
MLIVFSFTLPLKSIDFSLKPVRLGSGFVSTIAFSPDGTILVAAHRTDETSTFWQVHEVRLWDPQTQQQVDVLQIEHIQVIVFSPDGTLLALGSEDNTIHLWDVAGRNQVGLMQSPTRWGVQSVAFSPDGKTLASSGSGDNVVRLWDVQTHQQVGTLRGHTQQGVGCVAFSPDGRLLFSGGHREDEAVRVWDVQTKQQVGELIGHLDITMDLVFSPDRTILASAGGARDKAVYLWDYQAQNQVGVLGGHSAHIGTIAFSPDGKLLASTVYWDNTIHIWDIASQEQLGVLEGHNATDFGWSDQVAISSDGKWLACGSENGVELWELNLPGPIPLTTAYSPKPYKDTLHNNTWVSLEWRAGDFAVSHDVYFGDNFDDVDAGAESTFQGNQALTSLIVGLPDFVYPDGLFPGTTYYWRIDEVNETEPNSPWKGDVWSFSIPPKTAYNPEPADGTNSVEGSRSARLTRHQLNVTLSWTAGFDAKLHTVYFGDNFDDVNNAIDGLQLGKTSYTPGTLKLAKTYYWRIDEFDGAEIHKGDIWTFTTQGAVGNPSPSNGAMDIEQTPVLTWSPGVYGASHEVYFGTNKEAVKNVDKSSPEYKGSGNLGSESYEPGQLEWNTTYYWRVDEANNVNADSPWTGLLWSFTTANFLIIDDFELYNDINEGEEGSNRIYNAWVDGYDGPTNGSQTGHLDAPFYEESIVHGGNKSMPLLYDNAVGKSEATYVLTSNRDWTLNGVNKLTIWFRGSLSNAPEQMYVALNDSAVVNHDNPNAAQKGSWTEWNIELKLFADQGVNLADVNSITLGLGNRANPVAGGAGMMCYDDIRLYAP